jgi:glycosyltransferase involved in cell wall biosynthesis
MNLPCHTKIAIFHNFLDNIGGAEIVSLILARELDADIITTNIDSRKIAKMGFVDVLPRIFSIGAIPINPPWRQQLALKKFRELDLKRQYDFFLITGDWAISGVVNNQPNLWYVHSPIREIWDLQEYVRLNLVLPWQRPVFDVWVSFNRYLNTKYVQYAQKIACNSQNTQKRIKKYLQREALVISPPIETSRFYYEEPQGYWLSVNRLLKQKRVDMQLKAFAKLPNEKLIIVGSYEQSKHFLEYVQYCQGIKPNNVEFRSWVTREELIKLYAGCKGFITTSYDEDFGMNVVEAMAAGKAVIAPNEGGYRETIIPGRTGSLIDAIDEDKLKEAVLTLGKEIDANPGKYKEACRQRAKTFDTKIFIKKIKEEIELQLAGNAKKIRATSHAFEATL